MNKILLACLAAAALAAGTAAADAPPTAIPVYDTTAAPADSGSGEEIDEQVHDNHVLRNVSRPTLTPFLPPPDTATGTGVIVAPGGGFMQLTIDDEGTKVASWLASHGVAAFLLKYRLAHTPPSDALYAVLLGKTMLEIMQKGSPLPTLEGEDSAVADGLQAVRLVRRRAAEWGLDAKRVGFLGFSAGAIMAARVAQEGAAASRPAFIGAIYGLKAFKGAPPAGLPPLFLAVAADDPLFAADAPAWCAAWRKSGAPAELHLYERGGHGFGMRQQHLSSDHWIEEFQWWLESRGLVAAPPH